MAKSNLKHQGNYKDFPKTKEKVNNTNIVERQGYIPAKVRIEAIMQAGERLREFRREQFDFEEGDIDEEFNDPTRVKGFDMADATQMQLQLEQRKKEALENAKTKLEEDKKSESKRKTQDISTEDVRDDTEDIDNK